MKSFVSCAKIEKRKRKMNEVNKTLYIPLYGKSLVSKKGIILQDRKAEEIWEKVNFPLKRKSKSKHLAYFLGMRSAIFDRWTKEKINQTGNTVVLHLGCGLDSRHQRLCANVLWYDVDFDDVITERKKYFVESESYKMLPADLADLSFVDLLPEKQSAIVVMEGVSMYITNQEVNNLFKKLGEKYKTLSVLVDVYTKFGAKMSKVKNPIKEVGAKKVYGVKNRYTLMQNTGLSFAKEHEMTPKDLIGELNGIEKFLFKTLFAGKLAKRLYKTYEYETAKDEIK